MIPLPAFPTDNLYKFMTIFGIIIMVVSFFAMESTQEKRRETLINETQSISESLLRVHKQENAAHQLYVLGEVVSLPTKYDRFAKAMSILHKDSTRDKEYNNMIITLVEVLDTTKELLLKQMRMLTEKIEGGNLQMVLDALRDRIGSSTDKREITIDIFFLLEVFGVALVIRGSFLWYYKQQVYQDELFKKEFLKLNRERNL